MTKDTGLSDGLFAANDNELAIKRCNACKIAKPVTEFNKRTDRPSGIRPECRECQKERKRRWSESESGKNWLLAYDNDNDVRAKRKEYHDKPENKAASAARHKKWRDTPEGKIKLAAIARRTQQKPESKARRSNHRKNRYRTDPTYASSVMIRSTLGRVLKAVGQPKASTTFEILGYTPEQFKQRIECQFEPGMSWENRRHDTWHIDHKKPIAAFVAQGVTDPKIINALSNLRPMWATDNMTKGAVWMGVDFKGSNRAAA